MNRETKHNVYYEQAIAPVTGSGIAPTSSVIDLQGFDALTFVIQIGATVSDTLTYSVEESDDGVTFTEVAAADLIASSNSIAANTVLTVGYTGGSRYVIIDFDDTTTNPPEGDTTLAVVAAKALPSVAPVTDQ